MTRLTRLSPCVVAVFLLLVTATPSTQPPEGAGFVLVDLGDFLPEAINSAGQIAGVQSGLAGVWQDGAFQSLELSVPAFCGQQASGINASGAVAGYTQCGNAEGFLWKNGVYTALPSLGGTFSTAYALNNLDQVVGYAGTLDGHSHAALWDGSTTVDLGTLGGNDSWANGINDLGQIVGQSYLADGTSHAFLYDNGVMTDLGTLGGSWSAAYAIRNDGLILGFSQIAGDVAGHPFVWQNGTMTDLGSLAGPTGYAELVNTINQNGDMVGSSQLTDSDWNLHAVLFKNGAMTDLNSLLPPDSGWVLRFAQRINDAGEIVGQGLLNGENRGFLLIPNGATPTGSDVEITPAATLPNGQTTTVALTFDDVQTAGATTVTTSATGPPPSEGFKLTNPPVYYEITTTATFTGSVRVCLGWTEGQIANENQVRLFHREGAQWVDITDPVSRDTVNNRVCGETSGLSPFALMEVKHPFTGFFQPVDNLPTVNAVKAGAAVPVKFSLGGNLGLSIFAAGYPRTQLVQCATGEPIDVIEETIDAGNSALSYDAHSGVYKYVWKTDKAWANSCRELQVKLNDGEVYTARFTFRK